LVWVPSLLSATRLTVTSNTPYSVSPLCRAEGREGTLLAANWYETMAWCRAPQEARYCSRSYGKGLNPPSSVTHPLISSSPVCLKQKRRANKLTLRCSVRSAFLIAPYLCAHLAPPALTLQEFPRLAARRCRRTMFRTCAAVSVILCRGGRWASAGRCWVSGPGSLTC